MPPPLKLLVVQVAALGRDFLAAAHPDLQFAGQAWQSLQPVFPAVTCAVQATVRTGAWPAQHGMVGNGFFSRELHKALFWEQSSAIVQGPRVWDAWREAGRTVGMMFWQQSLGLDADVLLSPAPIHKHEGGMIQDCFSRPAGLHADITQEVGRPFNLFYYWGPLASRKSSDWVVDATCAMLRHDNAPELLFSYIPHLDYELQKSGPESAASQRELTVLEGYLSRLRAVAEENGYRILFYGDYAITSVDRTIFPNRALLDAGLFNVRSIKGREYPDLHTSAAFAMVDHQMAHVVCPDPSQHARIREVLERLDGVDVVLDRSEQAAWNIDHARSGDFVLVAEPDSWFAYPWWTDRAKAPDFAGHVDIHNKPGYDPCELFFAGRPLLSLEVSQDTWMIHGSHGLSGPGNETVFTTNLDLPQQPGNHVELGQILASLLQANA